MGTMAAAYDALLVVSFGGPEGRDDVRPFLESVLRGRSVPEERVREVAAHYEHFGGVSPLNAQCRALVAALGEELGRHGPRLAVYWGNRHWHPLLADTLRRMADDGVRRALAFVASAYGSHSGCRQYLDDLARARAEVGERAPEVDKLRLFYNHPGFVEPLAESVAAAFDRVPEPTALSRPGSSSPPTASRGPSPPPATTRPSFARPPASSPSPSAGPSGASSTRAAAGRRASRGSTPTSWTTCGPSPPRA